MRQHAPLQYLEVRKWNPRQTIECAACPTHFIAEQGVAFAAIDRNGNPIMAYFCCEACYLNAYPREQMWRA